jgi:hypothetical protein
MEAFEGWEWFYLDDDAQNIGPFTTEELQGFYQNEQFTDETYVWAEQCEAWTTIGLYSELQSVLQAPAAPEAAAAAMAPVEEETKESFTQRTKEVAARRTSVSLPPQSSDKAPVVLLKELSQKKYKDQAHWFLNAYWSAEGKAIRFDNNPEEREKVWQMYHKMVELDKNNGKDGNELDEYAAHIFLEKTVGAITVKKMRQVLVEIDVDFNQMVSLTEALIYAYKIDYKYLVTAVVDDEESKALLEAAQNAVSAATEALQASQRAAEEAAQAAIDAKAAAEEAALSAQKAAEDAEAAATAEEHAIAEEARAVEEANAATAARELANAAAAEATAARELANAAAAEATAAREAAENAREQVCYKR